MLRENMRGRKSKTFKRKAVQKAERKVQKLAEGSARPRSLRRAALRLQKRREVASERANRERVRQ